MVEDEQLIEVTFGWRDVLEEYLEWVKYRDLWIVECYESWRVPLFISLKCNGSWMWSSHLYDPMDLPQPPEHILDRYRYSQAWMPNDQDLIEHILKVKNPKRKFEYDGSKLNYHPFEIWLFRSDFRPWTSRSNMNRHIDVIRAILEYR